MLWQLLFIIALYIIALQYGTTLYVQKSTEDMLRNPPNGLK